MIGGLGQTQPVTRYTGNYRTPAWMDRGHVEEKKKLPFEKKKSFLNVFILMTQSLVIAGKINLLRTKTK
jgi:hypothetical protein